MTTTPKQQAQMRPRSEVRRSQLITTYGVGAIIASADESFMVAGMQVNQLELSAGVTIKRRGPAATAHNDPGTGVIECRNSENTRRRQVDPWRVEEFRFYAILHIPEFAARAVAAGRAFVDVRGSVAGDESLHRRLLADEG